MSWQTVAIICFFLLFSLGVWSVSLQFQEQKLCEERGGVYLRTASGYVCVDAKKIKTS